jgi:phospholipase C
MCHSSSEAKCPHAAQSAGGLRLTRRLSAGHVTTTTMPQIETVVMLILENRSLDPMLGWLWWGPRTLNSIPAPFVRHRSTAKALPSASGTQT